MTLTAELADKVEALYRESLEREFADSIKFEPISVEPHEDTEGTPTFLVTIVYDGTPKDLNTKRMLAAVTAVAGALEDLGLACRPIWSFVPKHEWPMLRKMRAIALLGEDGE